MRKTATDRKAEAARAQQVTEQLVRDRKTGELYNPRIKFDELMSDALIQATLKRLGEK